jgi:predicted aconitase with swiveling domain
MEVEVVEATGEAPGTAIQVLVAEDLVMQPALISEAPLFSKLESTKGTEMLQ